MPICIKIGHQVWTNVYIVISTTSIWQRSNPSRWSRLENNINIHERDNFEEYLARVQIRSLTSESEKEAGTRCWVFFADGGIGQNRFLKVWDGQIRTFFKVTFLKLGSSDLAPTCSSWSLTLQPEPFAYFRHYRLEMERVQSLQAWAEPELKLLSLERIFIWPMLSIIILKNCSLFW